MIYVLENDCLKVEINTYGAELQSVYNKKLNIEYLWHGDKTFWGRRSPVLFPIVGRLQNDSYEYDGHQYHMTQHGFARDSEFTLLHQTDNSIVFELLYSSDTLTIYPFLFRLHCHYILENDKLTVQYDIKNLSKDEDMYYSIGAHPAFSTKLCPNDSFDDYNISFYSEGSVDEYTLEIPYLAEKTKKQMQPPKIDLSYQLFDVDTLIYGVHCEPVRLELRNKYNHGVKMSFNQVDFVGIWTPNGKKAPFVCLEPWQGVADTTTHNGNLTQKLGIRRLQSEQVKSFSYDIVVF